VAAPVKIEGYSGTSVEPGVIAADRTYAAGQGVGKVGPARSCLSLHLQRFEDPTFASRVKWRHVTWRVL